MLQQAQPPRPALTERLRERLGRRAFGLALAIILELLLLLLLLTLGQGGEPGEAPSTTISSFDVAPAEQAAPQQEPAAQPEAGEAQPAPELQPEQPAPAAELPPPPIVMPRPAPSPPAVAPVSPPEPQATAAPRPRPRPPQGPVQGPPAPAMGPSNTGMSGDTPRVGTAPNGEPMYAARWYREPYDNELAGYLSTATGPGWGLIVCRTADNYRVEDCVALEESPQGSNIARAALAAAWQFQVRPPRLGGRNLVGAWVRIRIDYDIRRN